MLEAIAGGEYLVDVCLMNGSDVTAQLEIDVRRALDRAGGKNGKYDESDETRIASTVAYGEYCVDELGEIPFFEQVGENDWDTFNCLDATPIPMTVTLADGTVERPTEEREQCDNPQYIYDSCEPNAVDGRSNGPRVTSASNDQGTHWVLLCRKAKEQEGSYNDIAMIGHNPYSGKTCFFQNALYRRTDGLKVPHPSDTVESEQSPAQSLNLWEGIHGGLGSGIECAECHDADAFVHTPWIDGALNGEGDPIVPKMGINDDFVLGFNDAPYSILNAAGQGWSMPKQLVSEEASACTSCHRMGSGRWTSSWIDRLVGQDQAWTAITSESHRSFENVFWMPPEVDGLDAETWPTSTFGRAVAFIQECGRNPESCQWEELPREPIADDGGLPTIELEGRALAVSALTALGADIEDPSCPDGNCGTRRCAECHSVSRGGLGRWLDDTQRAWDDCGLSRDADEMSPEEALTAVNCLRVDPTDADSVFAAANLGILTTGVQYSPFRKLFRRAFGDRWLAPYTQFKARVGMPKGSHPKFSQREFATVVKWFQNDLVAIDEVMQEAPPPAVCTPRIDTPAMTAHVQDMQFDGWGAVNADNGIRMFGCSASGQDCFTNGSFPNRSSDWGNGIGAIRQLTKLGFRTSFWTRTSADGRFVGNGGGSAGSTITDLARGIDIGVKASYDPGFFPDNSGFIFQGSVGGAGICTQSVLENDDLIDFEEAQCIKARGINLYQHVARGVNGGDYFVINSQFTSDAGGGNTDPAAFFNATSTMKFTPMLFNGTTYEPLSPVVVESPYEGDSVLSPSSRLVGSRLSGPDGKSLGYVIRRVNASRFGDSYRIDIDRTLATLCMPGAKLNFSFDERFIVTHHYENQTANIYLADLLTGERYQITNMPEGSRALFPHFRSDGWFYFLVNTADGEQYVVASDAAVTLAR